MRPLRGVAVALLSFASAACAIRPPVTNRVTMAFGDGPGAVTVTATTQFNEVSGRAVRERADAPRTLIAAGQDEWALRFDALSADRERVTIEKRRGTIVRAERQVTIPRDQLQRVFSDLPMTVSITSDHGSTELAIYPGTSSRATRQQRERVQKELESWSGEAARYFRALDALYGWIRANPNRAEPVFHILFNPDEKSVVDEEQALIDTVIDAMDRLLARMERGDDDLYSLDEETDLVFNPFPAEISIETPNDITAVEGFEKRRSDVAVIPHAGLLDAVSALEGRWVSPDPLAIVVRADGEDAKLPGAAELAAMPRHSDGSVTGSEILKAVTSRLTPAASYRVRWSE